jgi:ribonuclease HI
VITIITDGSCDNKTGKGGWAAVIRNSATLVELTGWETGTTSNRMELMAAIESLRSIKTPSEVTVVTDSTYLLKTMHHKWYERWFASANNRPNMDLWKQLVGLCQYHDVSWVKVKGHSGDYWNTRVDRLAELARLEKMSHQLELDHVGDVRCEAESYGKRCYLYLNHSGDCAYCKEGSVFLTSWEASNAT